MIETLNNFNFIRPTWLLALVPLAYMTWRLWLIQNATGQLRHVVASHLLKHLIVRQGGTTRIRPYHVLVVIGVLMVLALAGPAWHREPLPFAEDQAPLILALDLSESMDAEDVKPSRLERAKQKARDLIALRSGARTGLLVYAGSAHTVLPLTDDPNVLETYLDALSTDLMPTPGKDVSKALSEALNMLAQEAAAGTIVFLTDGIEQAAQERFKEQARDSRHALAVWAMTSEIAVLKAAGQQVKMRVTPLTVDDQDVLRMHGQIQSHMKQVQDQDNNQRWSDAGYWLLWPVVGLSLLWFRRGWMVGY